MNTVLEFLTVEQVLAIHGLMIEEFGGAPEVRDHGLLESAVCMPQAKFGGRYLHKGLPAMAAAYFFHLCKNHPFIDGNKRTALTAAEVFIELNKRRLAATNEQLEKLTLGVADSSIDKETITKFFKKHVRHSSSTSPLK